MASLSQALRLGDLPPPHRTFQGHATHIIEWSMMLRLNDSWSTCILQGIATFLHYASRRSAGYRYTTRSRAPRPPRSHSAPCPPPGSDTTSYPVPPAIHWSLTAHLTPPDMRCFLHRGAATAL